MHFSFLINPPQNIYTHMTYIVFLVLNKPAQNKYYSYIVFLVLNKPGTKYYSYIVFLVLNKPRSKYYSYIVFLVLKPKTPLKILLIY